MITYYNVESLVLVTNHLQNTFDKHFCSVVTFEKVALFHEDLLQLAVTFDRVLGNGVVCLDDIEFDLAIFTTLSEEEDFFATIRVRCLVHPCCDHGLDRHLLDHRKGRPIFASLIEF